MKWTLKEKISLIAGAMGIAFVAWFFILGVIVMFCDKFCVMK